MNENSFREIYPVVLEQNLIWGDMDAFGHLNNVSYFRLFESARIAYFDNLKMMHSMKVDGIGPILHSTDCRYRYPLTYPDQLLLGARVKSLGEDRFDMEHGVFSTKNQCLAANGHALIVMVDYKNGGKVPVPATLRSAILQMNGQAMPEKVVSKT